ncbi:MAG: glycogen phosphorylase [Piscirickettsiaceae bacterium CG_4_9_14_3_um_filter_43_564]|nr:glycogen/starch/alpha-glucan phosphorylase [Thiomicrospira sp.]OIP93546.1 MAG: glycogen phosphorylase [Thiomicrospira sp. CG2_30_44_34]PIQ05201.1 MAG: glycogen phosphorylase [Piscirickettsiaceae bacterium CG18_big_fil_WC_8_21_14_2_50_44_103]PIU38796.1 MAG: glycogen phosphorylase [Piscirickettsiaceae bacterium CG07_land_8_20_14_0_80_44_28]PIW57127.1 MAG: glycogen phosphorylase [Piscirickettsiaceae bacterium CG12_big_fil_rev_8_21_14_0_65_44_934]PIW78481.1 MAG: glycogen phosphorylase [Pisciric
MTEHESTLSTTEQQKHVAELLKKMGLSAIDIEQDFVNYLYSNLGRNLSSDCFYKYRALSYTMRDRLMMHWKQTWHSYNNNKKTRKAYYLSMEFLIGRSLSNNMLNLGVESAADEAMYSLGLSLEAIEEAERDAGLGNGGLGRLAACFMDSCATLKLPVVGYGLRYEYGMFKQLIQNGCQVEEPDHWLGFGNYSWEIQRSEYTRTIKFGGVSRPYKDPHTGELTVHWEDADEVLAVPFDVPIPGYQNRVVNTLRLWSAEAAEGFNLSEFNQGSYFEAVAAKSEAENITMVLYPNDSSENGKELRLRQQYFLVSASLQDVVAQWVQRYGSDFSDFADYNVFQLNDTHPSLAVAELMRLLIDEHKLDWNAAWDIVRKVMAYTNHTLLPEALERWQVSLFERLLPRLLDIIYEINARFLKQVAMKWPGDKGKLSRMSIIDPDNNVCMAYLAIVGSFSINGVAALHSQLLKEGLFNDFYQLWPERFNNKTNGVTQRRWMASSNPGLRKLLNEKIGQGWITELSQLHKIEDFVNDKNFRRDWMAVKRQNKQRLADLVETETGVRFEVEALFDVQVKRIHEYKRQLLNILHVIHLYARIKRGETDNWTNRCVIIGGKAAPGYFMAKKIIKLINNVADVINNDPGVGNRLKLAFVPNYRVSAMEIIAPGADLSEQISTAGKEASGTGNMKFMMNGAITIGTLDGANVEILEAVGEENFFLFGLKTEEVEALKPHYHPQSIIEQDSDLQHVIALLESGHFNQFDDGLFDDVIASIKSSQDPWMTLADFRSYVDAQHEASLAFQNHSRWNTMSIINSARSGVFSTDRTMTEYNNDIWKLSPLSS